MAKTELEMLQLAIDNYNTNNIKTQAYDILYNTDGSYIITSRIEYNNGTNRQKIFEKRQINKDLISDIDELIKEYKTTYVDCQIIDYNDEEVSKNRFLLKGDKKLIIRHKITMESIMSDITKYMNNDNKIKKIYMYSGNQQVIHNAITDIVCQDSMMGLDNIKQISIATFRKNVIESEQKNFSLIKKYNKNLQHIKYIDIKNIRLYFILERFNTLFTFYAKYIQ